tara:strand:- start:203 stop:1237 length:1035 start_codon:yes stop_codon:yes gene_type:complete
MKMAPIIKDLEKNRHNVVIVHTGQHYDNNMSDEILNDLELREPDYHLGIMNGSHAQQTANIMTDFEKICIEILPKIVIVAGDVNSTLACSLVASKLNIKIAHVESGLRSFDKNMPEEINRIITDHISDLLFTTEQSGNMNLLKEGIVKEKIHFVGNCMIDSLQKYIMHAKKLKPWLKYGLSNSLYAVVTLHRPSNVDNKFELSKYIDILNQISTDCSILFPCHPRTLKNIKNFNLELSNSIKLVPPLGYLEFLGLLSNCSFVLTDSGGIQEETTALKIPCITLRENTERPITIDVGTNILAGTNKKNILLEVKKIINGNIKVGRIPELWDGKTAQRITKIISKV